MPELTAEAGRVLITDGGTTVFDTNRLNQIRVGNVLTGSMSVPGLNAANSQPLIVNNKQRINWSSTVSCGVMHPDATDLRGAINIVHTGTTGLVGALNAGWHSVGGTYVHFFGGFTASGNVIGSSLATGAMLFNFRINAATHTAYLDGTAYHDLIATGGKQGISFRPFTLRYYLIQCAYS